MTAPGSAPPPCGIAVPQVFVDEPVDMGLVREFSRRAEALGYHSLWTQEQIIGSTPVLEPISLLCHVAAVTNTIGWARPSSSHRRETPSTWPSSSPRWTR